MRALAAKPAPAPSWAHGPLQCKCVSCGNRHATEECPKCAQLPPVHRSANKSAPAQHEPPASVVRTLAEAGQPLAPALCKDMERRFAHDFSSVRIHTGASAEASAREVDAQAYTVGSHVVFANSRFRPEQPEGRRLIAHELTHVVQQSRAPTGVLRCAPQAEQNSPAELEADRNAARIERSEQLPVNHRFGDVPLLRRRPNAPGGCGVCQLPMHAGTAAHSWIGGAFVAQGGMKEKRIAKPGGGKGNTGRLDLALVDETKRTIYTGEVKPRTASGMATGRKDQIWYRALVALDPNYGTYFHRNLTAQQWTPINPAGWLVTRGKPTTCGQILNVMPAAHGLYLYECTPHADVIEARPDCACRKTKKKKKRQEKKGKGKKQPRKTTTPKKQPPKTSAPKPNASKPPKAGPKPSPPTPVNVGFGLSIFSVSGGAGNAGVGIAIFSTSTGFGTAGAGVSIFSDSVAVGAVGAGASVGSTAEGAGVAGAGAAIDSSATAAGAAGAGTAESSSGMAAGAAGVGKVEESELEGAGSTGKGKVKGSQVSGKGGSSSGSMTNVQGKGTGAGGKVEVKNVASEAGKTTSPAKAEDEEAANDKPEAGTGVEKGGESSNKGAEGEVGAGSDRGGVGEGGEKAEAGTPTGEPGEKTTPPATGAAASGADLKDQLEAALGVAAPGSKPEDREKAAAEAAKVNALLKGASNAQKALFVRLAQQSGNRYLVPASEWVDKLMQATKGITEADLEYLMTLDWKPSSISAEELRKKVLEALENKDKPKGDAAGSKGGEGGKGKDQGAGTGGKGEGAGKRKQEGSAPPGEGSKRGPESGKYTLARKFTGEYKNVFDRDYQFVVDEKAINSNTKIGDEPTLTLQFIGDDKKAYYYRLKYRVSEGPTEETDKNYPGKVLWRFKLETTNTEMIDVAPEGQTPFLLSPKRPAFYRIFKP